MLEQLVSEVSCSLSLSLLHLLLLQGPSGLYTGLSPSGAFYMTSNGYTPHGASWAMSIFMFC